VLVLSLLECMFLIVLGSLWWDEVVCDQEGSEKPPSKLHLRL